MFLLFNETLLVKLLKQRHTCKLYLTILTVNISICFDVTGPLTQIVWPWEPEVGVKYIFGGIPTLPSLSVSENAYRVLFTNASVNTCNNNLLTKLWS